MARPPPMLALVDVLLEEILLRCPRDDPVQLIRVAAVCKRWRRLVSDPSFRRRFREFHRGPLMLGFLFNYEYNVSYSWARTLLDRRAHASSCGPLARFVPASPGLRSAICSGWRALDSRHGRALLHTMPCGRLQDMVLWDPVTDKRVNVAKMPLQPDPYGLSWNAAVLCAAGSGCSHLDCSHGFLVVFVGCDPTTGVFSRFYSSEFDGWSEATSANHLTYRFFELTPPVLAANALYFTCTTPRILMRYDLTTREMSEILLPRGINLSDIAPTTTVDGGLGFAVVEHLKLRLWSREAGPNHEAGWAQTRVIELETILPVNALSTPSHVRVLGVADGVGVIFVRTSDGLYTIDPKSDRVLKLGDTEECRSISNIVPYIAPVLQSPGEIRKWFSGT